jgi:TM2 domain-containing membrane protein YozV
MPAAAPAQVYFPAPVQSQPMQHTVVVNNVINNTSRAGPRWNPGVAAMLSFFIPGLGQMYKGQVINGMVWFVAVVVGYLAFIIPGFVLHIFCIIGASLGDPYR